MFTGYGCREDKSYYIDLLFIASWTSKRTLTKFGDRHLARLSRLSKTSPNQKLSLDKATSDHVITTPPPATCHEPTEKIVEF